MQLGSGFLFSGSQNQGSDSVLRGRNKKPDSPRLLRSNSEPSLNKTESDIGQTSLPIGFSGGKDKVFAERNFSESFVEGSAYDSDVMTDAEFSDSDSESDSDSDFYSDPNKPLLASKRLFTRVDHPASDELNFQRSNSDSNLFLKTGSFIKLYSILLI